MKPTFPANIAPTRMSARSASTCCVVGKEERWSPNAILTPRHSGTKKRSFGTESVRVVAG